MIATMLKKKIYVNEYQQYYMEEWAIEYILKNVTWDNITEIMIRYP